MDHLFSSYANSLTQYQRRQTIEVKIGDVPLGGTNPIRIQSMTTVDTMDTMGSVEQAIRMIDAGCEYVRITAPSVKEAANLDNIKKELRKRGYNTPLVADIHFTPNAAELAARLVEKVRINPGNYADKKKFENIEYTDASYQEELERIRERFLPLLKICKEYGTAMRIGTNHGSLSDRIMSRYGDNPMGMVESALDFIRIAEGEGFYNMVVSMKSSNPQVMVQAYRLLVQKLAEGGHKSYPLHLGVTEAGEAEDGRVKSSVGIGTLLEDGIGDTVRVSLTEEPEFEIPVAKTLVDRYNQRANHAAIPEITHYPINPYQFTRRQTTEVRNFGADNVPRVIADLSQIEGGLEMEHLKAVGLTYLPALDKWGLSDTGADYIYTGSQPIPFMVATGSREIQDLATWKSSTDKVNKFPLLTVEEFLAEGLPQPELNFLKVSDSEVTDTLIEKLKGNLPLVLWLSTDNKHAMPALRRVFVSLIEAGIKLPVVISRAYDQADLEQVQLYAATDFGGLFVDGLGDGVILNTPASPKEVYLTHAGKLNLLAFNILQASRMRISKTEYISCPSCGRTLFNLQETTAKIRKVTDHLIGVKIGIMGCIVNGPGEMADADFGYVGVGKGKIALYKGQEVVKKSVPEAQAVDELINLIKEHGKWVEQGTEQMA